MSSAPSVPAFIRPIDRAAPAEIQLVAERMRDTLIEVLGPERGATLYDMDWLVARVRWHIDPDRTAEVLVADDPGVGLAGHCIVRAESDENGAPIGYFSTTYVVPTHRRRGIAAALITAGERFLLAHGLTTHVTDTDQHNTPLIALFARRGFTVAYRDTARAMVRLARRAPPP